MLEKTIADQITSLLLKEYSEADNRFGERLRPIVQGNGELTSQCLLLVADTHIQWALAVMKSAGQSSKEIAGELYRQADTHAVR